MNNNWSEAITKNTGFNNNPITTTDIDDNADIVARVLITFWNKQNNRLHKRIKEAEHRYTSASAEYGKQMHDKGKATEKALGDISETRATLTTLVSLRNSDDVIDCSQPIFLRKFYEELEEDEKR